MSQIIIWATDGSEVADHALPIATRLAKDFEATLVAVHVNQTVVVQGERHPVKVDEPDVQARLQRTVRSVRARGVEAELRVVGPTTDGVPHAIAEFAAAVDAKLIVLGAERRPALSAILHGSVAPRLLGRAPCPVVVVPPRGPERQPSSTEPPAQAGSLGPRYDTRRTSARERARLNTSM